MALAGVGCGSSSPAKSNGNAVNKTGFYTPWPLGGEPVHGGTATIDTPEAPPTFNPYEGTAGDSAVTTVRQVYDQLFELLPDGSRTVLEPALATSWKVSLDHLTYTFQIRPGVRFSNGEPLTGEDVVFSLKKAESPFSAVYVFTKPWRSVALTGPMTVQLRLNKPEPALLEYLNYLPMSIVPKRTYEREGAKGFGLHPIGTGPFMLKNATAGFSNITMARNPYYWRAGQPYLDDIVFNVVESDNARILAVRSGAADVAQAIPYAQAASLRSTSGVKMEIGPEWGAAYDVLIGQSLHSTRSTCGGPCCMRLLAKQSSRRCTRALVRLQIACGAK